MLPQKRKRKEKEDDTVSLSSFDLKVRVRAASRLFVGCKSSVAPLNVSSQQTLILLHDSRTRHDGSCVCYELRIIPLLDWYECLRKL